jgi:uncharacterized RDD family membrane protein YckC
VRLAAAPAADAGDTTPNYPGKSFGLALIVDWVLCELIVSAVTHHSVTRVSDSSYFVTEYWTLIVCFLELYLLTALSGLTIGKRLLGIRVIRTDGGRPGFAWAALRTVLLFFVVPPLLADRDLRGLHDRASDTIVVRM